VSRPSYGWLVAVKQESKRSARRASKQNGEPAYCGTPCLFSGVLYSSEAGRNQREPALSRTWAHVDLDAGWLRLETHETKNGEGRQFPLIEPVRAAIEVQQANKVDLERSHGRIIRPLFFTPAGGPISRYTLHSSFKKACKDAGHPERLFHDFRRTAVRNSTRAGIPRSVAKKLSGHLTDSVFERYDIVDEGDLMDAGKKLEERMNRQRTVKDGTVGGVR